MLPPHSRGDAPNPWVSRMVSKSVFSVAPSMSAMSIAMVEVSRSDGGSGVAGAGGRTAAIAKSAGAARGP